MIGGDRQAQGRSASHRDDVLDGSLAIAHLAHDLRAPQILQRSRCEFRGGGGHAVNQDDHWIIAFPPLARWCPESLGGTLFSPACGHHHRFGRQQEAENFDGFGEITAAIAAQVQNEGFHAVVFQFVERGLHLSGKARAELREPQVADVCFLVQESHLRH